MTKVFDVERTRQDATDLNKWRWDDTKPVIDNAMSAFLLIAGAAKYLFEACDEVDRLRKREKLLNEVWQAAFDSELDVDSDLYAKVYALRAFDKSRAATPEANQRV